MGPITERRVLGVFALAQSVALLLDDHHFLGLETGAGVGAVAPGLGGGTATAAPPVAAGLQFHDAGLTIGDGGSFLWHGILLVKTCSPAPAGAPRSAAAGAVAPTLAPGPSSWRRS